MANPFNPLDWIKTTQDWFAKTERSSGFRAYLIFFIIITVLCITLLNFFSEIQYVPIVALGLLFLTTVSFILLYFLKAHSDPSFCRSESHIQQMAQIEFENMGSSDNIIDAQVLDSQSDQQFTKDETKFLSSSPKQGREK